jgi:hypothetical protein
LIFGEPEKLIIKRNRRILVALLKSNKWKEDTPQPMTALLSANALTGVNVNISLTNEKMDNRHQTFLFRTVDKKKSMLYNVTE